MRDLGKRPSRRRSGCGRPDEFHSYLVLTTVRLSRWRSASNRMK